METIDVTLPGHLVSSGANLTSNDLLVIEPRPGRASISGGTLGTLVLETELRHAPSTLHVSLLADTWEPTLETNASSSSTNSTSAAALLLSSIRSHQTGANGWEAAVRPRLLSHGLVQRVSDSTIIITVPPAASFLLEAPEVVTLTVPAEAVVSRVAPHMALPTFILRPESGSATLMHTIHTETDVREGTGEPPSLLDRLATEGLQDVSVPQQHLMLNLTLSEDEWSDELLQYVDEEYEVPALTLALTPTLALGMTPSKGGLCFSEPAPPPPSQAAYLQRLSRTLPTHLPRK